MVEKIQRLNKLQQPKGVLPESPLRKQKENGWRWFSCIAAIFKILGRSKVDDQVREEIVRDGREIPTKESNTSVKPTRVRSNNTGKTSRKSTGAAVRAAAAKGKSKSKTISKG
jgi:phage terminase large subunit GpA-like protein